MLDINHIVHNKLLSILKFYKTENYIRETKITIMRNLLQRKESQSAHEIEILDYLTEQLYRFSFVFYAVNFAIYKYIM